MMIRSVRDGVCGLGCLRGRESGGESSWHWMDWLVVDGLSKAERKSGDEVVVLAWTRFLASGKEMLQLNLI
jgi:hypothetical protein